MFATSPTALLGVRPARPSSGDTRPRRGRSRRSASNCGSRSTPPGSSLPRGAGAPRRRVVGRDDLSSRARVCPTATASSPVAAHRRSRRCRRRSRLVDRPRCCGAARPAAARPRQTPSPSMRRCRRESLGDPGRWSARPTGSGSVDPFETAVRAVVGQQISVAGARTVAVELVAAVGRPMSFDDDGSDARVPSPEDVAMRPTTRSRCRPRDASTIRRLATAVIDGTVVLDVGADPGTHPLNAARGARHRTVDGGLRRDARARPSGRVPRHRPGRAPRDRAARRRRRPVDRTGRPWRSYAVHHLWASLASSRHLAGVDRPPPSPNPPTPKAGHPMSDIDLSTPSSTHRSGYSRSCVRSRSPGHALAQRGDGRVSIGSPTNDPAHPVLAATIDQLEGYFDGERTKFDVPLDPIGTPLPADGVGGAADDPLCRDDQLRRAGGPAR